MPLAGFETAIPASERPQTHALDPTATGIDIDKYKETIFCDDYLWSPPVDSI
jgi:hypothetical protein